VRSLQTESITLSEMVWSGWVV